MPFETGGRADKQGNTYEYNCAVYEMLRLFDEVHYSVTIEALGDDEKGTDILVTTMKGEKEHQQCKARNGSKDKWDISDENEWVVFRVQNFDEGIVKKIVGEGYDQLSIKLKKLL